MTALIVIACDGAWDQDRMPCRGTYPTTAPTPGDARLEAARADWRTSDGGDLCPAHARAGTPA